MIGTMFPDNLTVPALRFAIITILILCGLIVPTFAVSPETLLAALPTASEVTPGLDMENPPGITYRSDGPFSVAYGWEGYFRFTCPEKYLDSNAKDWFQCRVWAYSRETVGSSPHLTTGEIWKEWMKGMVEPYKDYPKLPDSVWFREVTSSESTYRVEEEIAFWVDQQTYVEVELDSHVKTWEYDEHGCTPSIAERKSKIEALVDSEAERIARLVRKNLLGEEDLPPPPRDYGELIWMLKYYSPDSFQKYSDEIVYKALVINETGVLGPGRGITYALKDNMMGDIQTFKKILSEPVPTRSTRLLDPISGRNIIAEDLEKAAEIVGIADAYLKVADALLGYSSVNPLSLSPLVDTLTFYHDLEKKMQYARDEIVIPDFAGNMYLEYKKGRSEGLNPSEAFDQAIYETSELTSYVPGKGWYEVRSYGSFGEIKDDSIVAQMVMERFEARYHEEELVDLHAFYLANEDLFIKSIMWQYRDKLDLLARTCQDLVQGKIVSKVTYVPQKNWWILPPELRE